MCTYLGVELVAYPCLVEEEVASLCLEEEEVPRYLVAGEVVDQCSVVEFLKSEREKGVLINDFS